jgi:hypothetical protein
MVLCWDLANFRLYASRIHDDNLLRPGLCRGCSRSLAVCKCETRDQDRENANCSLFHQFCLPKAPCKSWSKVHFVAPYNTSLHSGPTMGKIEKADAPFGVIGGRNLGWHWRCVYYCLSRSRVFMTCIIIHERPFVCEAAGKPTVVILGYAF